MTGTTRRRCSIPRPCGWRISITPPAALAHLSRVPTPRFAAFWATTWTYPPRSTSRSRLAGRRPVSWPVPSGSADVSAPMVPEPLATGPWLPGAAACRGDWLEARAQVLGGPAGDIGEPVGAHQPVPPFHRGRVTGCEPLDGQRRRPGGNAEQFALLFAGQDRPDALPARVWPDAAADVQFPVQGSAGEVNRHQRPAQGGGKPGAVQDDGLIVGQAQPLKVDERLIGSAAQDRCRLLVMALLKPPHDAALHEALLLHRAEQAVERTERLLDHPAGNE